MIAATSEPNKRLFRDDAQVDHVARTIDSADLTVASPNSFGLAALLLSAGSRRSSRDGRRAGTKISFAISGRERPEKWLGDTGS